MQANQLQFETDGAEMISGAVSASEMADLLPAFESRDPLRPGARSLAMPEAVAHMAAAEGPLGRLAQRFRSASDRQMRPVRVILFDKTPDTNWGVPWHQDRTIAVSARHEVSGFRNWNVKDGVNHVEPPVELLARMVTLRLHLDDTGADNGALDVLPGSHRLGRLPAADVVRLAHDGQAVRCVAATGDVLAMRLLTLHKSERAVEPSRRRVLHIDYSADDLPAPLEWQAARP